MVGPVPMDVQARLHLTVQCMGVGADRVCERAVGFLRARLDKAC